MPMRVYRCPGCACAFAILAMKRGKENKGGKGITCPLCQGEDVEEIDPVEAVGATLAKRALAFWKSLPSGD